MHEQDSIFCIFNNINTVKMSWYAQHFRRRVDHPLGKGARLQLACWRAPALPLVSLCSKSKTPTSCCSWPSTLTFYRGGKCKETFLIEINKATHYCILMWLKPRVFGVSWCVLKMHTTKLHVPVSSWTFEPCMLYLCDAPDVVNKPDCSCATYLWWAWGGCSYLHWQLQHEPASPEMQVLG